jgi:hypothetical protein
MNIFKSIYSLMVLISISLTSLPLVSGELIIESDYESTLITDAYPTSAPTSDYIFGTSHLEFWEAHDRGTSIISNCDGKGPYEGNQYWHLQFQVNYHDPCLGTTTTSVNTHSNIGDNFTYPQGTQNRVILEDAVTSNTMIVRFYFRTTGDWTSRNNTDGGGGLKFIRVFGNGGYGDSAAALIKIKNDGDSTDPTWNLYDPSGAPYNHYHYAGVDVQDGNWHSIVYKVTLNNTTGSNDNITSTFWIDDWDMRRAGHSQTLTAPSFGSRFKIIELFANWSADQAEYPMGIDVDKLEVWNGSPNPPPSAPVLE